MVAGGQGRVAPVGRPHGAALRRAAALNEGTGGAAAARVRVMLGLQRGGGEHGGRQSSQGAVPREGVPRESVLLQLKETKRVEGKEVSGTDSIDSSVSGGHPPLTAPAAPASRAGGQGPDGPVLPHHLGSGLQRPSPTSSSHHGLLPETLLTHLLQEAFLA